MKLKNQTKKRIFIITFLTLIFFEINFIFTLSLSEIIDIPGTQVNDDMIDPNQTIIYNFTNNNVFFGISTDSAVNLNLDLGPSIFNRKSHIIISNNNTAIDLNCTLRPTMEQHGLQQQPKNPSDSHFQYRYRYNHIIKIHTNTTIQNLTLQFKKNMMYGLAQNSKFKIGIFEYNLESWNIITTNEKINQSTSETYIEGEILNLEAENDYFITLFDIVNINNNWIWILVVSMIIGMSALVIAISKKEYLQFLRSRTIPIDKGVHKLTLEDVLENENRNKLIEFILEEPGIHFNELLRKTELSAGNLAWHLDILETYKVIGKKRIDRYLVFFPYYHKNPISNIDLKLQKSELTLKILEIIENKPGIYNQILANELSVDHKTISYHVNKLVKLELISIKKKGRIKMFFPNLEAEYFVNNQHELNKE
ncbi:MAG: winged helix-turn-helix transcriptional regulator [Candidatus Lokiarchaeota archaeon]|nr:winged helix-turn-helix transcriptional regulator [Candidatus Lokiarchaeota archaeon]